ncbi:MAG: PilT/PilU family type 4a pilus ATPase [Cloacibacillus porcorum]|uniref:type IV pilus twitching motility protein PilT n=1 Tax=Cloacibacillus porcorum TaxID=1197717 RepID=UPI00235684AF|nr:PilT/PilU family type 4a pilus ATPase [Cloacibacillus porcorum]MCI5866339.1 PilT/PilU family type 4a pilus ATPase [Cloacibacillus porcorum]
MPGFVLKDTLIRGINSCASDVHLSVGDVPMLRIDGNLVRIPDAQPLTAEEMREAVRELLTESQIERFDDEREYDFSFSLDMGVKEQRFRANFSHEKGNPALALRAITANIRTMKQLGLPDDLKVMTQKNNGLFLVTGPTGSGKSTTLAAIIQEINLTRSVHIVTIEDPIEYLYTSEVALIHQRELGRDTKTFAEALRRAMRQDPDVIMIGELRDLETISAAITAAETGHLVLATLHTRDAAQSIDRIIDVFPPYQQQQIRIQLSSMLLGVLSQQLIPLEGISGRTVATEYLVATNAVRNYIREGKSSQIKNVIQTGSSLGMHTMDQDLARLCREGMIGRKEALGHAYDVESFNRYMM